MRTLMTRFALAFALACVALVSLQGRAEAQQIMIDEYGDGSFQPCRYCVEARTNRGTKIFLRTQAGLQECASNRCMVLYPNQQTSGYGYNNGYGRSGYNQYSGVGRNIGTLMGSDAQSREVGNMVDAAVNILGIFAR